VQVAQAQAEAARLATYTSFEQMAQQRSATVREIIASRFDWDKALSELSRVVPADTSLQSLLGTVVPGVSIGSSSGGASTGTLRSTISAPAFEIRGCTKNQDEVAGVMSRLRLINGVTRVTLSDSQKTSSASGSVSPSSGSSSGCPARWPTFDLVVFFTPVPNAGAQGVASGSGSATPVPGASTPVATTTTTPTGTVATTSTTPGSSQPVTSTTSTTSTSGGTK
jgi:hypothetical protein